MSAEDYIERLRQRQPKIFGARSLRIQVVALEAALRTAFNAGRADAGASKKSGADRLFDTLFGSGLGKAT
jgi:hypothetical protein